MTWERYFYRQLAKSSGLFLLIFYGLYVLIDYSSHLSGAHYHHSSLNLRDFFIQYACEFVIRAEILLPFALLIGTVFTLTAMNQRKELIALLASGYSLLRLMHPYIISACIGVAILYVNNEFLLPKALKRQSSFDQKHANHRKTLDHMVSAHHLALKDGSTIIYRTFDPLAKTLNEVYWISSNQEIWRMELLEPFTQTPKGILVDRFQKIGQNFVHTNAFQEYSFPSMHFDQKKLSETFITPDQLPLSSLLLNAPSSKVAEESEKAARSLTELYRKLSLPWLALLAVIGPATFCLKFTRQLPIFFIFAGNIFGMVAIYLLINALSVLGERQVLSPFTAVIIPMAFFISVFLYRFVQIRTS